MEVRKTRRKSIYINPSKRSKLWYIMLMTYSNGFFNYERAR